MKTLLLAGLSLLALATSAFSPPPTPKPPLNGTQMALTDNNFTVEEFQAAVAANPALKDVAIASVKHLGLTPYSQAEFQNALTGEVDKQIGSKINEVHSAYDKDILELTGETKGGTEKTYDYLKRAVGSVLTARQTKIADLEKAIADGATDPTLKAQLVDLQKKEATWQEKEKTFGTTLFEKDVLLDLRLGQVGIKLNDALPESLRKLALQNAEQKVLAMAKAQTTDGKTTIVYLKDGQVALKDGQPATAGDLLREELKDVLDTGQQGQGGGAGGGQGGNKGGKVTVPDTLPADVKNQGQLIDYLLKLGVPNETKEFDEAFAKLGKGLPLR